MTKHGLHRYVDKLLLGKSYGEVHRAIDRPNVLLGSKHRRLFHTPLEAYVVGTLASSDRWGGLADLLHVWLDKQCSKDKEFKRWLEFSAK